MLTWMNSRQIWFHTQGKFSQDIEIAQFKFMFFMFLTCLHFLGILLKTLKLIYTDRPGYFSQCWPTSYFQRMFNLIYMQLFQLMQTCSIFWMFKLIYMLLFYVQRRVTILNRLFITYNLWIPILHSKCVNSLHKCQILDFNIFVRFVGIKIEFFSIWEAYK